MRALLGRLRGLVRRKSDTPLHLEPMGGDAAALHPHAGETCAACGEPFRRTDAVRTMPSGTVHDVCPR